MAEADLFARELQTLSQWAAANRVSRQRATQRFQKGSLGTNARDCGPNVVVGDMTGLVTCSELAERWAIPRVQVRTWCRGDVIGPYRLVGSVYVVVDEALAAPPQPEAEAEAPEFSRAALQVFLDRASEPSDSLLRIDPGLTRRDVASYNLVRSLTGRERTRPELESVFPELVASSDRKNRAAATLSYVRRVGENGWQRRPVRLASEASKEVARLIRNGVDPGEVKTRFPAEFAEYRERQNLKARTASAKGTGPVQQAILEALAANDQLGGLTHGQIMAAINGHSTASHKTVGNTLRALRNGDLVEVRVPAGRARAYEPAVYGLSSQSRLEGSAAERQPSVKVPRRRSVGESYRWS